MISTENLNYLYGLNYNALKSNLDGLTAAESLWLPPQGGNCINWVLGHILRSRQFVLKLAEQEWAFPGADDHYGRGSDGRKTGALLSFNDLLAKWDETHPLLMAGIGALTPEQLAANVQPFGDFVRIDTRERRLLFLHFHECYHLGQIALLRRLLGKEGVVK